MIIEDDNGVPVEVIVNADIVHTPWFQRHQDMLRGHNLKLISLAPGAPGIFPDLLSPRRPGPETVPLVRPEGADPEADCTGAVRPAQTARRNRRAR